MSPRRHKESHPWITFELDMRPISDRLWMLFGEIKSKIEHIANTPLSPVTAQYMNSVYMAKGALATSAIEGNTLTEEQALKAVQGKLEVPASQEYDAQALKNVVDASNEILNTLISGNDLPITPDRIKQFNMRVLHNLPLADGVIAGEITHAVSVGSYAGAPREDCEFLLVKLCDWLNGPLSNIDQLDPIVIAVIKAVIAHIYVAWIHPFGDGNGRTARLLETLILLKAGVPVPVGHLLSNHYNFTRGEYYMQLAKTSKTKNVWPFIEYAAAGLRDQLASQLVWIYRQLIDLSWNSYVESVIPGTAKNDVRHRLLAKTLGSSIVPVPINQLKDLSPAIAREYARLSAMTISRDVAKLEKLDLLLVDHQKGLASCNRALLLQFVPFRKLPA